MKKIPKKVLIFDISNILFRVAAVKKHDPNLRSASTDDIVGLCMHISILSIHKWYRKYQPDFVVFAFEGQNNWRKQYTVANKTRMQYKGNRVSDPGMAHYYQLINSFRDTIKAHTSICCLQVDQMEADDSIAGFCQLYSSTETEIFIVSGDKDFIQLLKHPNVKLVDPATGKLRNQPSDKEYVEDIDYWIFLKCIRGDMGDNVPSAFPRVYETRIRKAYSSSYERANLMNERWRDENGVEHVVGDLYNHNKILLDLEHQPEPHRTQLLEGVYSQVVDVGKYSHFHFLRFLEEYKLYKLREEAIKFADLFSNNQRFLKAETSRQESMSYQESEVKKPSLYIDAGGEIIDLTKPKQGGLLEF